MARHASRRKLPSTNMPLPWLQIIQWVPPIIELSRDLLQRTRRMQRTPPASATDPNLDLPALATPEARMQAQATAIVDLRQRVAVLEENERRQAELVSDMATQLGNLSDAVLALHRQVRLVAMGALVVAIVAAVALGFALR
jgi:hypothetical protein